MLRSDGGARLCRFRALGPGVLLSDPESGTMMSRFYGVGWLPMPTVGHHNPINVFMKLSDVTSNGFDHQNKC